MFGIYSPYLWPLTFCPMSPTSGPVLIASRGSVAALLLAACNAGTGKLTPAASQSSANRPARRRPRVGLQHHFGPDRANCDEPRKGNVDDADSARRFHRQRCANRGTVAYPR
jgi:hypothetical protein